MISFLFAHSCVSKSKEALFFSMSCGKISAKSNFHLRSVVCEGRFIPHHCSHTSPDPTLSLSIHISLQNLRETEKRRILTFQNQTRAPPLSIYICAPIFGEQKAKDLNFIQIDSSLCRVYSQGKQKEKDLDISKPTSRGFPNSEADVCQELGKCFRKAGQTGASNLSTILINPKKY